MSPDQGREDPPEASLLSRRQYLLGTGATTSGILTAATGGVSAATSPTLDAVAVSANHAWRTVQPQSTHTDPVVVAPALSYHGTNPASPRLRNVTADEFDVRVQEWRYLDGAHLAETVGCLIADVGRFSLEDGRAVELGRTRTNHRWTAVSFDSSFGSAPVVFSNAQTENGSHPVVTRTRSVTTSGMELRLQEEENEGPHLTETIGYLAVEPGTGTIDGRPFEVESVADVGTRWQTISFADSYSEPIFIADLQSYRGANTATVRYRNLTSTSVEVMVEEERSQDQEVAHLPEEIGYCVIEGNAVTESGYGNGGYGVGGYGE